MTTRTSSDAGLESEEDTQRQRREKEEEEEDYADALTDALTEASEESESLETTTTAVWLRTWEEILRKEKENKDKQIKVGITKDESSLGLSKEEIESVMKSSEHSGSLKRWFVELQVDSQKSYWIAKKIREIELGRAEILVGKGLLKFQVPHVLPAKYGFASKEHDYEDTDYFFLVIPYRPGIILSTWTKKGFESFPLSTQDILRGATDLIVTLGKAFENPKLRFVHGVVFLV